MKKVSVIVLILLLILSLFSCSMRNSVYGSDEEGLDDVLNPTVGDSELDPSKGLTWNEDSPREETHDETNTVPENVESSYPTSNVITTPTEETESKYEEISTEVNSSSDVGSNNAGGLESGAYEESSEVNTEPVESSIASTELLTEPETEEPYDGMEIKLSNSKTIINEAYNAGIIASGYSVAKGSGRIIQVDKDNPNIIQVVFETDDPNILVAINYHRVNENSDWKLINGLPISIIDLTETEE